MVFNGVQSIGRPGREKYLTVVTRTKHAFPWRFQRESHDRTKQQANGVSVALTPFYDLRIYLNDATTDTVTHTCISIAEQLSNVLSTLHVAVAFHLTYPVATLTTSQSILPLDIRSCRAEQKSGKRKTKQT